MPLISLNAPLHFPMVPMDVSGAPTLGTVATLTTNGHAAAFIVRAPRSGTIDKIAWKVGPVTGGFTMDVRVETVSRAGTPVVPSGTLWGTNTNGSQAVLTSDDNLMFSTTLTAGAVVTQGDVLAVVIQVSSAGSACVINGFMDDRTMLFPICQNNTGGPFAVVSSGPILGLHYNGVGYVPVGGTSFADTIGTNSVSSSTTPDTLGQRFQFPFAVNIAGGWLWGDFDSDTTVRMVTSAYHQANATGILASDTIHSQDRTSDTIGIHFFRFPSTVELAANTNYRLVLEPGASAITVYDYSFPSIDHMDAGPLGRNFHLTTAKDPTADGSWTNYNSGTFRQLACGLSLAGFPSGGSRSFILGG